MPVVKRQKTVRDIRPTEELSRVLAELKKAHGPNSIGAGTLAKPPLRIPTGSFAFDLATLGGIPHSRCSMVHGRKHSGKTYMADRVIMGAQQTMPNKRVAKIDTEGTHDAVWAGKVGVDNEALVLAQPDSGEQAVDTAVALVSTLEVSLVVIDSLASLVPVKEQESDAGDAHVALQARLITSMMRKITAAQIRERRRGHHVTVLTINQERTKIGGWSPNPEAISLPGGQAIGFFNTLEWRMKNKENTKKDELGQDTLAWNDHAFTIEKNKCNPGLRTGEFRMLRRDDPELGLTEAELDDAPIMLSYAKAHGLYTGTPKQGYTLEFGDYEAVHVGSAEDMVRTLYHDREYMWSLRCHLIALEARRQGMPEWFIEYIRVGELPE